MRCSPPLSAARVLEVARRARPDAEAAVARSGRLTYAALDELADRCVEVLIGSGVRPGDRVAVSLVNDLPLVALFHAAMRLGAIWVGLNRALAPPEKAYILRDSETACFIGDADMVGQVRTVGDRHDVRTYVTVDVDPGSQWTALISAPPTADRPHPDPLAPAAIAYTSGTTGFPKGVVHSQHNLMVPGWVLIKSRGYGPALRKADCFPLTILNLQVLSTLLVPQCGGTAIVMDRVDPLGIAEWIGTERATTWNGAPAMLYGLAAEDAVPASALASLDDVWTGGSHCPTSTATAFRTKFGHRVHSSYGSTEVPTVVTLAPRGRDLDVASSGPPLPHLSIHIVDEHDCEQPAGTVGEICVGPTNDPALASLYQPMLGYWHNEAATTKTLRGGLLHTGDIGFVDNDGFLTIQDRRQSLILRGGANVYPAEVERVINDFPGVAGSCALGIPDDRLGSRVVAVIEPRAAGDAIDLEALRAHCLANLARYKVPERFIFATLTRNSMGKVVAAEVQRAVGPISLG
jgi:long-chain acyl-CoA synthetase